MSEGRRGVGVTRVEFVVVEGEIRDGFEQEF